MIRLFFLIAFCASLPQFALAEEVTTEALGSNRYRLLLRSTTILEVTEAQSLLYPRALELCHGLQPFLGHYEFSSKAPINGQSPADNKTEFLLTQDISCGTAATDAGNRSNRNSAFGVLKTDQKQSLKDFVTEVSTTYLTQRAEGKLDQAYVAFSEVMRTYQSAEEWNQKNLEFNAAAGRRTSTSIWRVTIYDNPATAPEPGIYIAADYESTFEHVPFQCGYLIWYQSSDNRYVITREETGSLPGDQVAKFSREQIADIRKQFGCPAL
jgi:hypothetical protein